MAAKAARAAFTHFPAPPVTPTLPLIAVLGAPGTGALTLLKALQARLARDGVALNLQVAHHPLPQAQLHLLMGLDGAVAQEDRAAQEAADGLLRTQLADAQQAFRVIYGSEARRLENALIAIKSIASSPYESWATEQKPSKQRHRNWGCEKCSDPDCEQRLFSCLTAQR